MMSAGIGPSKSSQNMLTWPILIGAIFDRMGRRNIWEAAAATTATVAAATAALPA